MFKPYHRYFIDSNVFLYAASVDGLKKEQSLRLIDDLINHKAIAVTNVAVLEEVHFIHYRQTKNVKGTIQFLKFIISSVGEIYPITIDVLKLAWEIFGRAPQPLRTVKDYYHVSSMLLNRVDSILSWDTDFDRFDQIVRVDPQSR